MERNFSQHVKEILGYSREEAERLQNSNIVPEHLLLGIIRDGANRAVDVLVGLGASLRTLKSSLENELSASNNHMEQTNELTISKSTEKFGDRHRTFIVGYIERAGLFCCKNFKHE